MFRFHGVSSSAGVFLVGIADTFLEAKRLLNQVDGENEAVVSKVAILANQDPFVLPEGSGFTVGVPQDRRDSGLPEGQHRDGQLGCHFQEAL